MLFFPREEAMLSTYFETINDLLSSFGPVRDCSRNNGGCTRNFKCVSDRQVDSSGCVVSHCPMHWSPLQEDTGERGSQRSKRLCFCALQLPAFWSCLLCEVG